jgi:hypothetical protein
MALFSDVCSTERARADGPVIPSLEFSLERLDKIIHIYLTKFHLLFSHHEAEE